MAEGSVAVYEQALRQIKSVAAVRIRLNESGAIEEVHVLAGPERSPKQIVRDVESVLAAQFGLEIDHKKVSVAQVGEEEEEPEPQRWKRPKLVGVSLRTVRGQAQATVELQVGERLLEGSTEGFSSAQNKFRLLVEATVKALSPLSSGTYILVPEDVAITPLAKHKVAQVAVTVVGPGGEDSLVGCALVRSDDREAVVKATLDAVNRKVFFLGKP
ncbi:Hypothetical protein DEACI_0150 [Acididesulfobacillus acetoxydans]|uniref:Uncharacterized protein n=1 Tax=Acididesulfobacillus acetoxydans TaxID=1561005 RepID=A0A8S0WKQ0_9FIRM|nr:hypothetical protein [Acididesulfobacillus acetoxydans]CAA7599524.1 Hypothetical protein DEACI_0150 [Acididesulfobacillus acetoxydans]CEJ08693.1 Hypothetical protein DEACI_3172 [Acididesulfobacillus acetoxydans]